MGAACVTLELLYWYALGMDVGICEVDSWRQLWLRDTCCSCDAEVKGVGMNDTIPALLF
jgi:hypothetical protein